MHAPTPPAPIEIDTLADMLAAAQHHEFTDHGQTRLHVGTHSDRRPFVFIQNTVDGMGFELRTN